MKRTTVFLPETLERQLQHFARQQDRPVAEIVRDALTAHLDANRPAFRMPETIDRGEGAETDIAQRFDEYLFKDFDIHGGSSPMSDDKKSTVKRKGGNSFPP